MLSRKVSVTSCTAERVGGRVRILGDRDLQAVELKARHLAYFLFFPARTCSYPHVLVITVLSSVDNRRARLGIGVTTFFTGHGLPRGRD